MKTIFFNNSANMVRVYPEELRKQIGALTELYPQVITQRDMDSHREAMREAEALFSTWGMPTLTGEEIGEYLPNLKAVFYGAGSVQDFARPYLARGIRVVSAWAANAIPVAEFAVSLIQLCLKGFLPAHRLALGSWHEARAFVESCPGCYDARVGLLGLGMIGRNVAERLKGFAVDVVAYDPYAPDSLFERLGVKRAETLLDAFAGSDVVSNHIANLPQTQEILRYEHFSALPPRGAFINTGRNAQVHVPGLARAFAEEPQRTAFFDVTDPDEPPKPDNPLVLLPNAYFTPHMAGATGQEVRRMGAYMVEECRRFLAGEPLRWEVTEKMLETMA